MSARRPRRWSFRRRLTVHFLTLVGGAVMILSAAVYVLVAVIPSGAYTSWSIDFRPPAPVAAGSSTSDAEPPSVVVTQDGAPQVLAFSELLRLLLVVSVATCVIVALAATAVGWLVAGQIVRPLERVVAVARRTTTGDLSARIGPIGRTDEIAVLAWSVDEMLDALQRSIDSHARFAANASHELRTPLATTQTLIDVALADPNADRETFVELAHHLRDVNRRSLETVDALLDLADAQNLRPPSTTLDVAALVDDTVAEVRRAATSDGITLHHTSSSQPVLVTADHVLLRQALFNVLSNAVRHNIPGGNAHVGVVMDPFWVTVCVENTGPVVDEDRVRTLLESFVRDRGRVSTVGVGRGLGLAVVQAVLQAHGGEVHLAPRPAGGLIVSLRLPRR